MEEIKIDSLKRDVEGKEGQRREEKETPKTRRTMANID